MNWSQNLQSIYPELIILTFGIMVILLDLFISNKRFLAYFSILGLCLSLIPMTIYVQPQELFSGMLVIDPLAVFFKIISVLVVIFTILISMDYRPFSQQLAPKGTYHGYAGEYYALLLFLCVGFMLMAASTNLLMIQLSIEFVSIISYILVSFNKKDARSSEAGLKYFLVGAIASGIMLYGISLIYGLTGTIDLRGVFSFFNDGTADSIIVLVFLIFLMAGFGFKVTMVPFHWWVPDVYEGAPTPITALLSVGSKAAGFAILFRTFLMAFPGFHSDWSSVLAPLAVVTMTVGNVVAISQTNMKRLLAYSSIAHAGYILVGVAIGYTAWAKEAILMYIVTYYFMNLGAFTVVILISNSLNSDDLSDYAGLYKRAPGLAASFAIFLLSLTGIPPLAGFFGKFYLFAAAIDAGTDYYWLALAVAINTVIASYYYFMIIRHMYILEPKNMIPIATPVTLRIAIGFTLVLTLAIVFFLGPLIDIIRQSTHMLSWL